MPNVATANGATLLTVPANTIWRGTVILSATLTSPIAASAAAGVPSVTIAGSGGNIPSGDTVVALALATPAVGNLSLVGMAVASSVSTGMIYIQARANPVSLILNFGAGVTAVAVAIGEV